MAMAHGPRPLEHAAILSATMPGQKASTAVPQPQPATTAEREVPCRGSIVMARFFDGEGQRRQSLTAPMVRPATMWRCMKSVKMTGGRIWITDAAAMRFQ